MSSIIIKTRFIFIAMFFVGVAYAEAPANKSPIPLLSHHAQQSDVHPTQVWSISDYIVLEQAIKQDQTELPKAGSIESGEQFEAMVSRQSLEILRNQHIPLKQRLKIATKMAGSAHRIFSAYVAANEQADFNYEYEMASLLAFMIEHASVHLGLWVDEQSLATNSDAETRKHFEIQSTQRYLKSMTKGILLSMGNTIVHSDKSILRMAKALDNNIARFALFFDEEFKIETAALMESMSVSSSDNALQKLLKSSVQKLLTANDAIA